MARISVVLESCISTKSIGSTRFPQVSPKESVKVLAPAMKIECSKLCMFRRKTVSNGVMALTSAHCFIWKKKTIMARSETILSNSISCRPRLQRQTSQLSPLHQVMLSILAQLFLHPVGSPWWQLTLKWRSTSAHLALCLTQAPLTTCRVCLMTLAHSSPLPVFQFMELMPPNWI